MINLIQGDCSTESILTFINDPRARTPAVYRIISWAMPDDGFGGSITLEGSQLLKEVEVSQVINFEGLRIRHSHFHRVNVSDIFDGQKPVTLEATDQNVFRLIADGFVFFEGKAMESNTKSSTSGSDSNYGVCRF